MTQFPTCAMPTLTQEQKQKNILVKHQSKLTRIIDEDLKQNLGGHTLNDSSTNAQHGLKEMAGTEVSESSLLSITFAACDRNERINRHFFKPRPLATNLKRTDI